MIGHNQMDIINRFKWLMKVSQFGDGDVRRLDVKVVAEDDPERPLTSLIAFVGKPS